MSGSESKYTEIQFKLEKDNPELCRNDMGLHIDNDDPTIKDVAHATNLGYSKVYSNCFSDKKKITNFRHLFSENPDWKETATKKTVQILGDCYGSTKRYTFTRKQDIAKTPKCCKVYTKNSSEQKQFCDVNYCKGSDACTDSEVLEGCLDFFTKDTIDKYINNLKKNEPGSREYTNDIKSLEGKLNPTDCNIDLVKNNKELLTDSNLPYLLENLLNIIIDIDDEEKRKDLVELCTSNLMRFLVRTNEQKVIDNLKGFCDNDKLFNRKNFESDNFIKKYQNICSCFWSKDIDNGNPVHENDFKIKELKSVKNLPEEISKIIKYESDIEPSGPNECWYNKCIDKNESLTPERGDKCPTMNIASCFSNLDFENLGEITADKIELISQCTANIDSKHGGGGGPPGPAGGPAGPGPPGPAGGGEGGDDDDDDGLSTGWIIGIVIGVILLILLIIGGIIISNQNNIPQDYMIN